MFLVWVAFLLLTTVSRFLKNSQKICLIKFCSRILHIITAYAKDTYKLKIYLAKLKSLSFILWLIQVIFMANTFYCPKPFRNLTQKSKLALYCHDISVLFKRISVRYIPFFLFSINPAQTHSTFCSDFIYLF